MSCSIPNPQPNLKNCDWSPERRGEKRRGEERRGEERSKKERKERDRITFADDSVY